MTQNFRKLLVIIGGLLTLIWGISHLFPTWSVVNGFGNLTPDNRQIITMEWMMEGFTLIFIGILVIAVTWTGQVESKVVKTVYLIVFLMLVAMAALSAFTGFKIDFLPFKLCPFIFMISGILIAGGFLYRNQQNEKNQEDFENPVNKI
jgi:purine-cytosine permease-like protein